MELCKNKCTLPKQEISATIGGHRSTETQSEPISQAAAFRLTLSPLAEVDGTEIEILVDSGATISCLSTESVCTPTSHVIMTEGVSGTPVEREQS